MRTLLRRAWYLIRRRQFEADLAEELEFHRSMTTGAAFGSATLARNQARDVWIWPWLQDIVQDLQFAARLLAKDRRFTATAVVALGLGIGANTTVFTFINTALFKDLPFDEPRQLMALGTRDARGRELQVSYPDFLDWRTATRAFDGMAAQSSSTMNLSEETLAPVRLRGSFISANVFGVLRVAPILGRRFMPEDEQPGAPASAIIGYDVWTSRYGSDPAVIGRQVRINEVPSTIIGVMPPRFRYPGTAEVWQPFTLRPGLTTATRETRNVGVIARLRESVTVEQARSDLSAIADELARRHPETNRGVTAAVARPMENVRRGTTPFLLTMLGAVGFVLLIACASVANLMLARAAQRAREIAIRASLGATRWRIVRQLLMESLVLAGLAGVLGLVLSAWGVRYFGVAFDAMEIGAPDQAVTPYWVDLSMDRTVFAFVAALCLGSCIVFGLAPALHISKTNVNDVLKESGRTSGGGLRARRWTSALMIGELALTLVLLTGAGLLVRSFLTHYSTNLVIDASHLTTVRLALVGQKYPTPGSRKTFFQRLDERLGANPAFASVSLASDIPFATLGGSARQLTIEGIEAEKPPTVSYVYVSDGYFETLGLHVIRGRPFTPVDAGSGQEAAIVNQRFATMFFASSDALGRRIRLASPNATGPPQPWLTIVGVVPTIPGFGPEATADAPLVYAPVGTERAPGPFVSVLVRSEAGLGATASLLRDEVRALDPDLPLYFIQTMDDVVARTRFPLRLIGSLFGLLALIGVVLASVGLYALTAHSVTERTQEIGVRMALGARTPQVAWLFIRRTLVQLAVGLTLGLWAALAVGKLLQSFLVRTGPRDPITLALVAALLVTVALAACFFPVRRAARVDPIVALRYE